MAIFRDSKFGIGENIRHLLTVGGDSSLNGLQILQIIYVDGDVSFQSSLDVLNYLVVNEQDFQVLNIQEI